VRNLETLCVERGVRLTNTGRAVVTVLAEGSDPPDGQFLLDFRL
jgi:hypothetical protein